jgi:hypothetical protein
MENIKKELINTLNKATDLLKVAHSDLIFDENDLIDNGVDGYEFDGVINGIYELLDLIEGWKTDLGSEEQ